MSALSVNLFNLLNKKTVPIIGSIGNDNTFSGNLWCWSTFAAREILIRGSLWMLFLIKLIGILSISLETKVDQTPEGFFCERGNTVLILLFPIDGTVSFHKPVNFPGKNAANTRGFLRKWEDVYFIISY